MGIDYDFEISPLGEMLINYFKEGIIAFKVNAIKDVNSIEYQFVKYFTLIVSGEEKAKNYNIDWVDEDFLLLLRNNYDLGFFVQSGYVRYITEDLIFVEPESSYIQVEEVQLINMSEFINKYVTVKHYEF